MLGYSLKEIEPHIHTWEKLIHPDDMPGVMEALTAHLEGKTPFYENEHRLLTKAGEWIWALDRGKVFERDKDGKPLRAAGTHLDITERKRAEVEIIRTKDQLTAIINSATGFYIATSDLEGAITSWNKGAELITGYTEDEAVGRINFAQVVSEEAVKSGLFEKTMKEILEKGSFKGEINLRRKNGEAFPAYVSAAQLKDESGSLMGMLAIVQDITERKRAEEKIKQAAEEWKVTFDSIVDLVSIHDKDFKLVRANKAYADVFKMKPGELIGKTCYEVFHGTKEPPPYCPHKQTLETKKPHTAEFFEPHLGAYFEFSTSPMFNEKGEVTGSVHIVKDITERKQAEEKLIVTDRLASVGELASGIAHELNNPLTGVIGFSELLLEKDIPDEIREDIKIIYSEAQRTAAVVKNLLTFARKHVPAKQLVNINSIIEKVLELRAYEQRVSNIQVITQFAPDLPEITADGFQLQQVFLNIIINAEHFMIEANNRGTLTITTERAGDIIKASFADDGPGISKDDLGHLFDPFFTTKEVGKGTGLGLSICHGIITEHDGRIYAKSEPGKGATFVVELPISK